METDGVIAEITSENFQECIGGTIEDIIKNNDNNREVIYHYILNNIFIFLN